MDKHVAAKDIINFLGSEIISIDGNPENIYVTNLKPPELVDKDTLDWINKSKKDKQKISENSKAKVIIVDQEVQYSDVLQSQGKVLIQVSNPKDAILKVGNHFFIKRNKLGIHESVFLHPNAKLGKNIYVGEHASIGACSIGDDVKIFPNVVISDNVTIGNNVIIKAGAVIGFDGFGYERNQSNNWVKFPQLGNLIIRDNVEIGSNTCIDRGSLSDTIIGFNTKINNLCHIAHNVVIGENVIITAHVNISGSTIIMDDVWVAPNASFRGHQRIGKGATIGMGAVVTKDVPAGETWLGNPAKKVEK